MVRIAGRSSCTSRGLSIIEVLFSMGIIAVGLLGVLTILPVAGVRTTRGLSSDTADRMGRNAIRQFDVRGMARPENWTRYDPVGRTYREVPPWPQNHPIRSRSFCIDPLFVASHADRGTNTPAIEFFPYYLMQTPEPPERETRMQRISLRNYPDGLTGMSFAAAMEIFSSQDDLIFDLPTDPTLPPLQNFSDLGTRRQAMGRFSWLATLTPKQHREVVWNDVTTDYGDSFILSIVVFHDRDMSMHVEDPDTIWETYGPANERLLEVEIVGMGFAGGEVKLKTRPGRPVQDLDIRPGNWLMLSTRIPTSPEHLHFFRWYRVVSADADVDDEVPWSRNVSLHGSDWFPDDNLRTQATVLSNVVAVYEKTVRLEHSSLWTMQ